VDVTSDVSRGTQPDLNGGRSLPETPARRSRRFNGNLIVGAVLLVFAAAITVLVPLIAPYSSNQIDSSASLKSPSWTHWLGTDQLGRDLLVRVAHGYQISFTVAIGSVAIGLLIGVPLGLLASMGGSLVDNAIMRPLDILMSFPAIVLSIVVVAISGTGLVPIIVAVGIVYIPIIARVMRGSAMAVSRELYVEAARSRGASVLRILGRHILPNSFAPVLVQASLLMGIALLLEAALSFIGLGVRPPTASLGLMLSDGRQFMANSAWVVAGPGIAIIILVLAFTVIGDGLQEFADPRTRRRAR
jgi:peptide/nickel transport system permease protein